MVAVALTSSSIMTLLITGSLAVRWLIIQNLYILIIIIIICFLTLGWESTNLTHTSHHIRCISRLHIVSWSRCSINVIVSSVCRSACRPGQIASWAKRRRLMDECLLLLNIHWVHIYVLVVDSGEVLQVTHVSSGAHEELLLLRT